MFLTAHVHVCLTAQAVQSEGLSDNTDHHQRSPEGQIKGSWARKNKPVGFFSLKVLHGFRTDGDQFFLLTRCKP